MYSIRKSNRPVYPRTPTPETIAEAKAWLAEACEMDGIPPTPENLRATAEVHANILPAGSRVFRESLILALA